MEAPLFDEGSERPATVEEREYVNRALFQYGVFAASLDDIESPDEPQQRWAENPCIIPGEK